MIEAAANRINKFRKKGVLLDTNLFLVYLVGMVDRGLVPKFKRTSNYRVEDFELLAALIQPVEKLFTTPHVATELDNLADHLDQANTKRFRDLFQLLIPQMKESHQSAKKLCKESAYKQFGLADASINEVGRSRLILTDDLPLLSYIENTGGNVLNFANLRPFV